MSVTKTRTLTVPIVEVFGPTIQGEGPLAGAPSYFVRVGGCDYRCSWCDSLYAVEPDQWRDAPRLDAGGVLDALLELPRSAEWVTLSGGNPGMYAAVGEIVDALRRAGYRVACETQGSRWQRWMTAIDCLVLSPKPPSSGMATIQHELSWKAFCEVCVRAHRALDGATPATALKLVVFDDRDFEWALARHAEVPWWPCYLSVGTDAGASASDVLERYTWLAERVMVEPRASACRVLPQLHVLLWGHARGV